MRRRCRLGFPVLLAMSCVVQTAHAAPIPRCAVIDRGTLPEPANCQRRFGVAAAATPDALHALADTQMKIGHYGEASAALGCAATQLVDSDDMTRRYEWIRRRGVLAYRQEHIADALGHFECALAMAEARGDRAATAKQLKNVGSALRRIGDYGNALRMLERGVQLMRADGDLAVGGMLANIADVYRETGKPQQAERYYREAEEAFRRKGDVVEAAHVLDSLSALALERGDPAAAARMLEAALQDVRNQNDRRYQPTLYASLAQAAIADGNVELASRHAANGLAIAAEYDLPTPPSLQLQAAQVDRLQGKVEQARIRLQSALEQPIDSDTDRAALMEALVTTLEQSGRDAQAIAVLRAAHEAERSGLIARSDHQFAWLLTRFEAAESERTIAALRHRTLQLWLGIATTLALLLAISILFIRRQQRAHVEEAVRRAQDEEMIVRYRREADALGGDRDLLQTLFDSRTDALCLLDADGALLAVNRAACSLLGGEREAFVGSALSNWLDPADAAALTTALERMEDAASQRVEVAVRDGAALRIELAQWEHGDGLIVMHLQRRNEAVAAAAEESGEPATAFAASVALANDEDARTEFRRALVELMLASIEAWERATGQNRIELAERSRIWCINIDDGRLRTRAMERYMSLSKLPRNPRWRDVLRSAYYVLGQCQLDAAVRDALQRRVDVVLAYARRSALV